MGRGLKLSIHYLLIKLFYSRLTYVGRGLKLQGRLTYVGRGLSPHIRGARIETSKLFARSWSYLSPHIRGARIETIFKNLQVEPASKSPHIRGARIETMKPTNSGYSARSPHIRGARIETLVLLALYIVLIVASHTWGED